MLCTIWMILCWLCFGIRLLYGEAAIHRSSISYIKLIDQFHIRYEYFGCNGGIFDMPFISSIQLVWWLCFIWMVNVHSASESDVCMVKQWHFDHSNWIIDHYVFDSMNVLHLSLWRHKSCVIKSYKIRDCNGTKIVLLEFEFFFII